ncbi:MAG: LysR family transcriptional regulator [Myxococcales bacterium]|nr:LysR family transcriptional regulator [Myxococcales bacterium]
MMSVITRMNLSAIDLNLFVVLAVVFDEGSATRAAARLHVTQSAVSNALARLRAALNDPLFVRGPRGLLPTPRAAALAPKLREALGLLREVVDAPGADAPTRLRRQFVVACTDVVQAAVLPRLLAIVNQRAPGVRIRAVPVVQSLRDELASGGVDLLIGAPPSLPRGCRGEVLWKDDLVCLASSKHATIRTRVTLAQFATTPHIDVAVHGQPQRRIDRALAAHKRKRTIVLSVPHFSVVPECVAESNAIAVLPRRFAIEAARRYPLVVLECPIALDAVTIKQIWHDRSQNDPALAALRLLVREATSDAHA